MYSEEHIVYNKTVIKYLMSVLLKIELAMLTLYCLVFLAYCSYHSRGKEKC